MTVIHNTNVISCSPEEAFDYLSDIRNELEWNPGVESVEMLDEGPVTQGSRFRAKWKGGPRVEIEVVEHDRPRGWTMHNGGAVEVTFTARVEPVPEGTRLTVDFDARPHGLFRLVFPLFLIKLRRDERANMTHLKVALERRVGR